MRPLFILLLPLLLFLASCSDSSSHSVPITLTVSTTASWSHGDKLLVDYDGETSTLELKDGAGQQQALFTGQLRYSSEVPTEHTVLSCRTADNRHQGTAYYGSGTDNSCQLFPQQ